ncbi:putative cytidine/deoxycytidylate deaminase [Marmoricola endophyticus]|uniref:Cytidine/deoxycytidylate deaminase n=1 Tax=Marmoricola endophyticus TaxID=2040280 RepID=A0A917F646_9ACTN|nr:nucleoside deaminase [Marmoricola endophyticus]GGF50306.1 putative cytidine/deoxycytidylate deaminase [Marmoricola endophyticus]
MTSADLAQRTIDLALTNVEQGGKPFACVVADADGTVLTEATNQVVQTGDVTAHAEVTAIRGLAERGRTSLAGCTVYVTAFPCPMCLAALYYADPDQVVFAATREQEGEHYEDGGRWMTLASFYDEIGPAGDRSLPLTQGEVEDPAAPFRAYAATPG